MSYKYSGLRSTVACLVGILDAKILLCICKYLNNLLIYRYAYINISMVANLLMKYRMLKRYVYMLDFKICLSTFDP